MLLAERFPEFPFAVAADRFLANLDRWNIEEQLLRRRITHIRIVRIPNARRMQGLVDVGRDGNLVVLLKNHRSALRRAVTLGHEIGHTFAIDLQQQVLSDPPLPAFSHQDTEEAIALNNRLEAFCETFGYQWAWSQQRAARRFVMRIRKNPQQRYAGPPELSLL